jgi:uncharacterized cupin superfamily protein
LIVYLEKMGKSITYYWKSSAQSIQRNKPHQNWKEKKQPNMINFGIWEHELKEYHWKIPSR